jgi:hypothetical protein
LRQISIRKILVAIVIYQHKSGLNQKLLARLIWFGGLQKGPIKQLA